MNAALSELLTHYRWELSLLVAAGVAAVTLVGKHLLLLSPTVKAAQQLNRAAVEKKMQRPIYAENQKLNLKWGAVFMTAIFGLLLPFCLTLQAGPWWTIPLDIVVILLFYDFFYYLTHRFLFHDSAFLGGPLKWMHAVHHQQHNPCRKDSSYIHPLEVAIGLGLYVGSIFVLSLVMGKFHVLTIVITWVAFSQLNLHNHDLWEADHPPFKYLNYLSKMHHNHHARFTGGNFATISLLYDWMFGTLDNGAGYRRLAKAKAAPASS